jgi:hypothetical protein
MIIAFWKNIFYFTLVTMIFFGAGTSLGEVNNLGFLKSFPTEISAGYASGLGLSGLIGTVFYLLLKIFDFSFYTVNLSMLVFYPLYVLMFHFACVYKKKFTAFNFIDGNLEEEISQESISILQSNIEREEAEINQYLSWKNLKMLWPYCNVLFIFYFLLYLFEYVSNSWLTSHIVKTYSKKYPEDEQPFFIKNGFELASVCFRFFLFAGRSSMFMVYINRLRTLLFSLFFLLIFYLTQALSSTLFTLPLMFVTLSFIGLIGGILFSNIIRLCLVIPGVEKKYKEIVLNILGVFGEGGMFVSSILGLLFLPLLP